MPNLWDRYHIQICSGVFAILLSGFVAMVMWLFGASLLSIAGEMIIGSWLTYSALEGE